MDKDFVRIMENAKKVMLFPDEKRDMRINIELYALSNPAKARGCLLCSLMCREDIKKAFSLRLFKNLGKESMLAAVVTFVLVVGTILAAAGESLPGNTLYPLKVHVSEQAESITAISDEARAAIETEQAEERILEAEQLALEGKLNSETRPDIESGFENAIANFHEVIERMENENKPEAALEASGNLAAIMEVHSQMLEQIMASKETGELEPILTKIKEKSASVDEASSKMEASISEKNDENFKNAAEGKLKAAEHKIAITTEFIQKAKVSEEVRASGLEGVTEAQALLGAGKLELEAGNYGKAFVSFHKAHRRVQEAKVLVATSEKIKVDITTTQSQNKQNNSSLNGQNKNQNSQGNGEEKGEVKGQKNLNLNGISNQGGLKLQLGR